MASRAARSGLHAFCAVALAASSCRPAAAAVVVALDDKGAVSVSWNGLPVILPQTPGLPSVELLDRDRRPVPPGKSPPPAPERMGNGARFSARFEPSGMAYEIEFCPAGPDALDISVSFRCGDGRRPGAARYIDHLSTPLCRLSMRGAPFRTGFVYPGGYVPAAVARGRDYAVGIAALGLHDEDDFAFTGVGGAANREKDADALSLSLSTAWSQLKLLSGRWAPAYTRHIRLTFGPASGSPADLAARPELWRCYLDELDARRPAIPLPKYDPARPVLMTGFSTQARWATPENPMGYEYFHIKGDEKYWRDRGFAQGGDPTRWVLPLADEHIRQMKRIDAQGMILWSVCWNPLGGNLNYIPEASWFHPDLERRMEAAVSANWDYLTADVELIDAKGTVLARTSAEVHAADRPQRVEIRMEDLTPDGAALARARGFDKNRRLAYDGTKFRTPVHLAGCAAALGGLAAGKTFSVPALVTDAGHAATPQAVAASPLRLNGTVRKIERTAVNAFIQRIHDAGFETGFINRGGFTCGVPWKQTDVNFDWSSEWQYGMFARRFRDFEERFGPMCRWFYIDTFGINEPPWVFRRLRLDFPNLVMAPEHEYDCTHRIMGISLAGRAPTPLERLVNPSYVALVRTSVMEPREGETLEETIARTVVRNPAALPLVQPHVSDRWLKALEIAGKN